MRLRGWDLLDEGLAEAKVLDGNERGQTSKGWTYAGNVSGESVDFVLLKGPVREAGEDVLCMEAVECGDLGAVRGGEGGRGGGLLF